MSQRAKAHAKHSHTCPCGRTVNGNGGWASHRWACPVWQAQIERIYAEHPEWAARDNVRRAPEWEYDADARRWVLAAAGDD